MCEWNSASTALVDNNLNGTIPNDIGLLGMLEVLALRSNRLTGSIPIKIKNITSLKILDLQHNLIDEFPASLPQTLKILQLSSNKMVGMRPKEVFTNLLILQVIDFSRCNLTCNFPDNIKYLTSLEILNMEENTLGDKIPTEVGLLKKLKQLKLSTNYLDESIPSEIGQCKKLITLELSSNTLGKSTRVSVK
jgi:Leucine-rich repeat (LRR) protein